MEQLRDEQQLRQKMVCSKGFARRNNRYVYFPVLQLAGKWLADCGFKDGHIVDIVYSEGQLVISIAKEQLYDV